MGVVCNNRFKATRKEREGAARVSQEQCEAWVPVKDTRENESRNCYRRFKGKATCVVLVILTI